MADAETTPAKSDKQEATKNNTNAPTPKNIEIIFPSREKLSSLSTLQLVPFDATIKQGDLKIPHSDLSEIDYLEINGQRKFAGLPDKANPGRLHIYNQGTNGELEIENVALLLDKNGKTFENGTIDPESIRFYKDQNGKQLAIITSEGESIAYDKAKDKGTSVEDAKKISAEDRARVPKIYVCELKISIDGKIEALQVFDEIDYPEHYKPKSAIDPNDPKKTIDLYGARANGSFESSLVTKDGKLVLITEFPLVQDSAIADINQGGLSRFLSIGLNNNKETKEYAYSLDKIPVTTKAQKLIEAGHKIANQENGVVSIYEDPKKPGSYLVMERSFLRITDKDDPKKNLFAENSIRIYRTSVTSAATDVTGVKELQGKSIDPLKKELALDFKDLESKFKEQNVRPDNFEGFTIYQEGDSLYLRAVSDNNSNANQGATQILKIKLN